MPRIGSSPFAFPDFTGATRRLILINLGTFFALLLAQLALRERVAEMLRKDSRVKHFRLGAWNEGGAGVTIAELA